MMSYRVDEVFSGARTTDRIDDITFLAAFLFAYNDCRCGWIMTSLILV